MLENLVSLLLTLSFYVLCVFAVALVRSFRRGRTPRAWVRRGLLLAGFAATYFVGTPVGPNALMWRIEHRYTPPLVRDSDRNPDNLIVVLSAGWFRWSLDGGETKMSEDGWERVDAGVKLWRRIGGTLLMTGGPAPGRSAASAAGEMADAARAFGVPESAIVVEPRARNTYENLTFSAPWIREHRGHVWLVTSALHMPRAMAVAKRLGFDPVAYPCFYRAHDFALRSAWWPSNSAPDRFDDVMHEALGMIAYRWRGWAN